MFCREQYLVRVRSNVVSVRKNKPIVKEYFLFQFTIYIDTRLYTYFTNTLTNNVCMYLLFHFDF